MATRFPRSKRLPEKKIATKWENFAKEKGIHKRKKAGMGYDKDLKTQVARWGKNSKKNAFEPAIMEEKEQGRNPFLDEKNKRKLGVQKEKLRNIKNRDFREGKRRGQ